MIWSGKTLFIKWYAFKIACCSIINKTVFNWPANYFRSRASIMKLWLREECYTTWRILYNNTWRHDQLISLKLRKHIFDLRVSKLRLNNSHGLTGTNAIVIKQCYTISCIFTMFYKSQFNLYPCILLHLNECNITKSQLTTSILKPD